MLDKADNPLDLKTGLFADDQDESDEGSAQDLADLGMVVRKSEKFTPVYVPAGRD